MYIFLDPALKEPKHLPCLHLDSGSQFFMTDAAVKYLLNDIEEESDIRNQVCKPSFDLHQKIYPTKISF